MSVSPYREPAAIRRIARAIATRLTRRWTLMEVCGGQTHAIVRFGLDQLMPDGLTLLHGPGCPVCVTPVEVIDRARALARHPEVVLCTFGDMLRVPGSGGDLRDARAAGADIRVVTSALDALGLARSLPDRVIALLSVGFETTAPGTALLARQAAAEGLENLALLVAHVRVPPALDAVAAGGRVQGFLAAGHVCAVEGVEPYRPLARRLGLPLVVTGFEPLDLLLGVLCCVEQLETGRAEVENAYARVVREAGNPEARAMVDEVFEVVDQRWRGLGVLPASGLALRPDYARFDALRRFPDLGPIGADDPRCRAGEVLQGLLRPDHCSAFGGACTPDRPLGAPMVSSEGACAAWHRYRRKP